MGEKWVFVSVCVRTKKQRGVRHRERERKVAITCKCIELKNYQKKTL